MICAHCDKPIRPGEPHRIEAVETGSGAAPDVQLHLGCQQDPLVQPNRGPREFVRY
ncbi:MULTISPECIES: hypothetical protein [unclassified Streptomyces]|uniref:hypothetical protein n=1 Tax=unclassified Streptomyces TaxID=2593676 RepID=UPI002E2BFAF8|nr:hypothetical protein [Streptomyces sp. NBC_01429]